MWPKQLRHSKSGNQTADLFKERSRAVDRRTLEYMSRCLHGCEEKQPALGAVIGPAKKLQDNVGQGIGVHRGPKPVAGKVHALKRGKKIKKPGLG